MFECLLCKATGIEYNSENLVPHILNLHKEIGTKKYKEMFPSSKLRNAPKTSYNDKEFRAKSVEKSISIRSGKGLSDEHRSKIGNSNKNSEKYKKSREEISRKFQTGELIGKRKFIDKEILENLYLVKKLSIRKICYELKISKQIVSREIDRHKIQKNTKSEAVRLALNNGQILKDLTNFERDIIYGEILGDGCLTKGENGTTPYYRHSCKYIDYIVWLKTLLPNVFWNKKDIFSNIDKKTGKMYHFINSNIHEDFSGIFDKFYYFNEEKGKYKKRIPEDLKINPTVLLHWFLGDGSASQYVDKKGKKHTDIYFSTFDFNEYDLSRIVIPQLNEMGIFCKVKLKKSGPILVVYAESYKRFYEIIGFKSPVSCYEYKFDIAKERFPEMIVPDWESDNVEESFNHYRNFGFPFFIMDNVKKHKSFEKLKKISTKITSDNIIKYNKVGLKLANVYHPHRFNMKRNDAKKTAIKCFCDDKVFTKILKRLKDKYNKINNSNVRAACSNWGGKTPINFTPSLAKFIIENYSKEGDLVLDPCAGFGGRMLGCLAANRKYFGIDPEKSTVDGLNRMGKDLSIDNFIIKDCTFEDFNDDIKADLIFTCPPYFNLERYNDNNKDQSYIKYGDYESWKDGFLFNLIEKSHKLLKDDGYFCIQIENFGEMSLKDDFLKMCENKFSIEKEYKHEYRKYDFSPDNSVYKYESIFVLKKIF